MTGPQVTLSSYRFPFSDNLHQWELRKPEQTHYYRVHDDHGAVLIHANPNCSGMLAPVPLPWPMVESLWDDGLVKSGTRGGRGRGAWRGLNRRVGWCESCAVK